MVKRRARKGRYFIGKKGGRKTPPSEQENPDPSDRERRLVGPVGGSKDLSVFADRAASYRGNSSDRDRFQDGVSFFIGDGNDTSGVSVLGAVGESSDPASVSRNRAHRGHGNKGNFVFRVGRETR